MTMTTEIEKKPQISWEERKARNEDRFFNAPMTLGDFNAHSTVSFDTRFHVHDYRLETDAELGEWIFDLNGDPSGEPMSEGLIKAIAYERMVEIRARKGQINRHEIYVEDVEEIECFERFNHNHATIDIVQDRADKKWRFAVGYNLYHTGGGSGISFKRSKVYDTRRDVILAGAKSLLQTAEKLTKGHEGDKYKPFYNKIKEFVEAREDEIRQPTLF